MIKRITIDVIPHHDQRYNTVGDWRFERDESGTAIALNIKVSDISDGNATNMLIAIHEFAEAVMCELGGIKDDDVDNFDMGWIPRSVYWRKPNQLLSEPGEDTFAPYYRQHQIAVAIERLVAAQLWVDWSIHEFMVDELVEESKEFFAKKQDKREEAIEAAPVPSIDNCLADVPFQEDLNPSPPSDPDDDIPF